jgi:purine-nucleoside/S-methyl-5'-thioadenosine phosphorylase / adenosine deaminase
VTTRVAGSFRWLEAETGKCLRCELLDPLASHVFTTRQLEFREQAFDRDAGRLVAAFGAPPPQLVWVRQVHGRAVTVVSPGLTLPNRAEADAIVSNAPDYVIAVRVADCVPVLMADRHQRAVAAIHAGWRGACSGVIGAAIDELEALGVPSSDLVAAVGPSIGPCCYQVDDRVRSAFLSMTPDSAAWFAEDGPGHWRLDLWQAARDQLEARGVPSGSIGLSRLCTADNLDDCFSYRREGPTTGRMVAAIRLSGLRAWGVGPGT